MSRGSSECRNCRAWIRHSLNEPSTKFLLAGATAVFLNCGSLSPAQGQDRINRDFYNPGTGNERADWTNAHKFHLQPAFDEMKLGRWKSARDNFEFILRYFPNSPQALNGISELCDLKWSSAQCDADSWFEKAVAVNPSVATTWVIYGLHFQRKKRLSEAVEKFQYALTLEPNNINGRYNLGLAYFDLKEYEKANEQAQISYALGAPLPGLRDMLKRVGAWKPVAGTEAATK